MPHPTDLLPLRLVDDPIAVSPTEGHAAEQQWLRSVAGDGQPTARLWRQTRALIVTRKDTRLPHYDAACQALAALGWPVHVRDSGGTAVPAGPGILNLSLFLPVIPGAGTAHYYQRLGTPLLAALGRLGLDAHYGPVPGSFCDGRYNLVVGGLKITGTAQRWLAPSGTHTGAVLAHAMVMVAGDMELGTEMASRFYELAGSPTRFQPGTSTTVAAQLGWQGSEAALIERCRTVLLSELG